MIYIRIVKGRGVKAWTSWFVVLFIIHLLGYISLEQDFKYISMFALAALIYYSVKKCAAIWGGHGLSEKIRNTLTVFLPALAIIQEFNIITIESFYWAIGLGALILFTFIKMMEGHE